MPVEIDPGAPLQPLTLGQYERMVEVGVLDEDDRLELLDGLLVAVTPTVPCTRRPSAASPTGRTTRSIARACDPSPAAAAVPAGQRT